MLERDGVGVIVLDGVWVFEVEIEGVTEGVRDSEGVVDVEGV